MNHIDRKMMRFAYRDVGKGREQDAEASQAQHILQFVLPAKSKF